LLTRWREFDSIACDMLKAPWTIWLTGLSGSGKTTIAKALLELFRNRPEKVEYLRLDEIRQIITPNPVFTKEEREFVYRSSVYIANILNRHDINVIIDSVDGEGTGRALCRQMIPNFEVIYVQCSLDVCIERERVRTDRAKIEKLYERAIQGELKIAGYGNPYATEEAPFLIIQSDQMNAEEAATVILKALID
jgi:adenylylsulfate kinase